MDNKLTKALFAEQIDTIYRVELQHECVELKLIKCTERNSPGIETFTLIFEGRADQVLDDNTYQFHHEQMGLFNLFISPYRQVGDKINYDAHFTKIVDEI